MALLPAHHPTSLRRGWPGCIPQNVTAESKHCFHQVIGVQWTLLPLYLQKRNRTVPNPNTAYWMLWDVPVSNITSPFPCCLCSQIYLLPDVAYLAETAAHAGARVSCRFVAKKLTSLFQVCCSWQDAELQQRKQEGSCSAHSHDA